MPAVPCLHQFAVSTNGLAEPTKDLDITEGAGIVLGGSMKGDDVRKPADDRCDDGRAVAGLVDFCPVAPRSHERSEDVDRDVGEDDWPFIALAGR